MQLNYDLLQRYETKYHHQRQMFNILSNKYLILTKSFFKQEKNILFSINLVKLLNKICLNKTERLANIKEKLELINPENILSKGYSIVYNEDNDIVRESIDLSTSNEISIKTKVELIKVKILKGV